MQSALEATFANYWRMFAPDLPEPEAEYRFHPTRRWRFDYCFVDARLAVELDGGIYIRGRHNRAAGFIADCDKMNAATLLGYRILRYTTRHLSDDPQAVINQIREALNDD